MKTEREKNISKIKLYFLMAAALISFPVLSEFYVGYTGKVLVASPNINHDKNFAKTVIYIFDHSGLKLDYNSGGYITATPALGDIDGDGLDEIIFGQYGNPKLLYALNVDGSSVDGFPYNLDEKVQRGATLCDFNGNGRDDIVIGADDEFIHLILDDGTLAWSYETGGDIRVAPTVLELTTGEKIILVGSKDVFSLAFSYHWLKVSRGFALFAIHSVIALGFTERLAKSLCLKT